jgi:ATP synthase F1 gamma subunit
MASTRELRRRIRSISSTSQITKAMQMVAASKMRKAQQAAIAVRPFARLLYRIQRKATTRAIDFTHPLLEVRPVARRAVILVASDKGLCGALNTNVFRLAANYDPKSTVFITAGRKAAQFVARTRRQLVAEFPYGDTPRFPEARAIAGLARDLFLKGDVDEVRIVATRFVNTLTQQPVILEFLPIGQIRGLTIPGAEAEEAALVRAGTRSRSRLSALPLSQHIRLRRAAQRQGQRAERAHGVDEERDRQRRGDDQGPDARLQQAAPGSHHAGVARDRRRPVPVSARLCV